jgi:hypothetical protein
MSKAEIIDEIKDFIKAAKRIERRMENQIFTGANDIRNNALCIRLNGERLIEQLTTEPTPLKEGR